MCSILQQLCCCSKDSISCKSWVDSLAHAGILVGAALLNVFSTQVVSFLNLFSFVWHVGGVLVLLIFIPAVAPTHQSAAYVFWHFSDATSTTSGISNNVYIFLVGMLMAQFTITGGTLLLAQLQQKMCHTLSEFLLSCLCISGCLFPSCSNRLPAVQLPSCWLHYVRFPCGCIVVVHCALPTTTMSSVPCF